MYCRKSIVNIDNSSTFNEIYRVAKEYTRIDFQEWKRFPDKSLATHSFVVVGSVNISITTKWYNFVKNGTLKACTYCYRLDGGYKPYTSPLAAHATMSTYYKCPDIKDIPGIKSFPQFTHTYYDSAKERNRYDWSYKPLLVGCKDDDVGKTQKIWSYDLNSAYPFGAMQPVPDFEKGVCGRYMTVPKGYIGFMEGEVRVCDPGEYADVVFQTMESPYKKWAERWYNDKRIASKKDQSDRKTHAKDMMNLAIGYLQIVNPLMRAAILHNIETVMYDDLASAGANPEDILMINTDAIYSKRPLKLPRMGCNIGDYKLEHDGVNCTMLGKHDYVFENEKAKQRGVTNNPILYRFDEEEGLVRIDV